MRYELTVPVNPVPLARPRTVETRSRAGRLRRATYTPDPHGFKTAFAQALLTCRARPKRPLDGPLAVAMTFWRRHAGGARMRGDIDNLAKAVLDAGNRLLWGDDSQVVELYVVIAASGPTVDGRIGLILRDSTARGGPVNPSDPPRAVESDEDAVAVLQRELYVRRLTVESGVLGPPTDDDRQLGVPAFTDEEWRDYVESYSAAGARRQHERSVALVATFERAIRALGGDPDA